MWGKRPSFGAAQSLAKRQRRATSASDPSASLPANPPPVAARGGAAASAAASAASYSFVPAGSLVAALTPLPPLSEAGASRGWFASAAAAQAALDSQRDAGGGGSRPRAMCDERCGVCSSLVADGSIECAHCDKIVCEVHSLMCDVCQDVYCTFCSTIDYSGRFEVGLCISCSEDARRGSDYSRDGFDGGGGGGGGGPDGMEM